MNHSLRVAVAAALALLAALSAGCVRRTTTPVAQRGTTAGAVRFLLVNDVYVLDTLRDGRGGLARVAALRQELERDGGRVLFGVAGGGLSPSLLSKWYAGRQMVDAFNAARLDYATFGNHEFELDRDTLVARIRASRFRWVSASETSKASRPTGRGTTPWALSRRPNSSRGRGWFGSGSIPRRAASARTRSSRASPPARRACSTTCSRSPRPR